MPKKKKVSSKGNKRQLQREKKRKEAERLLRIQQQKASVLADEDAAPDQAASAAASTVVAAAPPAPPSEAKVETRVVVAPPTALSAETRLALNTAQTDLNQLAEDARSLQQRFQQAVAAAEESTPEVLLAEFGTVATGSEGLARDVDPLRKRLEKLLTTDQRSHVKQYAHCVTLAATLRRQAADANMMLGQVKARLKHSDTLRCFDRALILLKLSYPGGRLSRDNVLTALHGDVERNLTALKLSPNFAAALNALASEANCWKCKADARMQLAGTHRQVPNLEQVKVRHEALKSAPDSGSSPDDKAIRDLQAAHDVFRKLGSLPQAADVLEDMARVYYRLGRVEQASACYGAISEVHAGAQSWDRAAVYARNQGVIMKDFNLLAARTALIKSMGYGRMGSSPKKEQALSLTVLGDLVVAAREKQQLAELSNAGKVERERAEEAARVATEAADAVDIAAAAKAEPVVAAPAEEVPETKAAPAAPEVQNHAKKSRGGNRKARKRKAAKAAAAAERAAQLALAEAEAKRKREWRENNPARVEAEELAARAKAETELLKLIAGKDGNPLEDPVDAVYSTAAQLFAECGEPVLSATTLFQGASVAIKDVVQSPQAWLQATDVLNGSATPSNSVSEKESARLEKAMVSLERCVKLFVSQDAFGKAGAALKSLGVAATLLNRLEDASKFYAQAVVLLRKAGDEAGAAEIETLQARISHTATAAGAVAEASTAATGSGAGVGVGAGAATAATAPAAAETAVPAAHSFADSDSEDSDDA